MRRTLQLQGLRMLKLRDVLSRCESGRLSQLEAAEVLGISERSFRRWSRRFEEQGEEGLLDGRVGRASGRAVSAAERARVECLYRERYHGFTAKHFHEVLVAQHNFRWGYTWTKTFLQSRGLIEKAKARGAHRRKRPRRPMEGMMLHQDASKHVWLAGQPALDLVATMDDATSEITSLFLVREEGTASSFQGLAETFAKKGLPMALYTDRGGHYFFTPVAGAKVDRSRPTQVGRALAQLGTEHIAAYSPEARGRPERMFRTLQDRLVNELAQMGFTDMAQANAWIRDDYLPRHNARFATPAAEPGSAYVTVPESAWRDILCVQETRQAGLDNTVRWKGLTLQIPPSPYRPHFVRASVRVSEYPDGRLTLHYGPRRIAAFAPDGTPDHTENPMAA